VAPVRAVLIRGVGPGVVPIVVLTTRPNIRWVILTVLIITRASVAAACIGVWDVGGGAVTAAAVPTAIPVSHIRGPRVTVITAIAWVTPAVAATTSWAPEHAGAHVQVGGQVEDGPLIVWGAVGH
jgi:hypothetical protein